MKLTGWDRETSPFHEGEAALQDRMGLKSRQEALGRRMFRPFMPDQHRDFFQSLPFMIAGSVDENGWPWASILFGAPGFVNTPDARSLTFAGGQLEGDPFWRNAKPGAPLGFLGIELPTRRRNRVNGVVRQAGDVLDVEVIQSFGNCPQYIHTRQPQMKRDPQAPFAPRVDTLSSITPEIAELIAKADTFFVASHNPQDDIRDTGGVDVSHRGGRPGFVRIDGDTLTVPDYNGNSVFNTFGNFLVNPKAGLLFIDFDSGDLVQLTGTVELVWDLDQSLGAFRGAERGWRFTLDHGQVLRDAAALGWQTGEPSPNSQLTGTWVEAEQAIAAEAQRNAWRPFRVARVTDESSVIRSFVFEPQDGAGLPTFKPGQFLTLRVNVGGETLTRTYTVSSAPADPQLRISVKREGVVSSHLHQDVSVGDVIEIRAPRGRFWMETDERRPAVLLAGGVGITPMMAMARQANSDGLARRQYRSITVVHAAKTTAERAFASEFDALAQHSQSALRYVSVIARPAEGEKAGVDFSAAGRVTPELLQRILPLDDYDFYLCGPPPFMQAVYDMLLDLGVRDGRIMAEAFGPASLTRRTETAAPTPTTNTKPAGTAVVSFAKSGFEQGWTPAQGSLLEFAEAHGIAPSYGCRGGSCGSCAVKLKSGAVQYAQVPSFPTEEGEALICCAVPAQSDEDLALEL